MKHFYILLVSLVFLSSCADEDAPLDTETNKYYADYIEIYNAYDSLGAEQTLKNLDVYMQEFPERKEAYVFKGYILGTINDYKEADLAFEEAKQRDSANLSIYEYQSAFLLYDSTQWDKAEDVIQEGLAISDSSVYLYTNIAWLQVFKKDYEEAINSSYKGIAYDQNNVNIHRPLFIALNYLDDEKEKVLTKLILEENGVNTDEIIEVLNEKGPLGVYKSIAQ